MKERFGFVLVFLFVLHVACWGRNSKSRHMGEHPGTAAEPLQLVATAVSGGAIRLYWNDLEQEQSFVISRSSVPDESGFELLTTVEANTTGYLDEHLQPGIYYYQLSATLAGEPAVYSNRVSMALAVTPLVMTQGEVTVCNAVFLDPGGLGNYGSSTSRTLVVRPPEAGKKVRVEFQAFEVMPKDFPLDDDDKLEIFDGVGVNTPLLGTYTGTELPPVWNATSTSGALTFRFTSDGWLEGAGWQAQLACVNAPGDLHAVPAGGTQVHLTWEDYPVGETGFRIERRAVGAEAFTTVEELPMSIPYLDDVPADNRYEYRVAALGDGPLFPTYSNIASVVVGQDPFIMRNGEFSICDRPFLDPGGNGIYPVSQGGDGFTTVTTVLKPSVPGTRVSLELTAFDMEDGYDYLTVYDGADNSAMKLGDFTGAELPPRLTATHPDGKLTLVFFTDHVVAHAGWRGMVTCITAPLAPDALAAEAIDDIHIRLTWADHATDETGYVIERRTGKTFAVVATVGPNTTTYDDLGLATGKTYTYRVKAVRNYAASVYSAEAQATVGTPPLFMQDGTFMACNARFTDPAGDDDFKLNGTRTLTLTPDAPGKKVSLQFSTFELDNHDKLLIYDGPTTAAPLIGTYMRTMLPPGIVATNSDGSLTISIDADGINFAPGWEAQVTCINVPETPGNLQAELVGGQTTLTWDDLSDKETAFAIDRATGTQFINIDMVPAGTTGYIDTSVPADRTLTYRVRALNNDISSAPSSPATVVNGVPPIVIHNGTITTCAGVLRDNGVDEPYGEEHTALTIEPDAPGKRVVLTFSRIDVGQSSTLRVWNGVNNGYIDNIIWNWHYWDTAVPEPIQSSMPSGRLTLEFRPYQPDPQGTGWEAHISCVDKGPLSILFGDRTVEYKDPDDDDKIWVVADALAHWSAYLPDLTYSIVDDPSSTGEATLSPNNVGSTGVFVNVTKIGTIKIKATVAENTYFLTSEKVMTLTVNKGTRSIHFAPALMLMTAAPRKLEASLSGFSTSIDPEDFQYEMMPPPNGGYQGRAELDGAMITPTYPGYIRVKASLAETDLYKASEALANMELRRAPASIQFVNQAMSLTGPSADLAAQAYAGADIFYSLTGASTGGINLSGPRSQTATPIASGTVTVTAFVPESRYYTYAEKQATLTVVGPEKLAQTINFDLVAAVTTDAPPLMLEATATSGLTVAFKILSGPATLSGRQVSLTGQAGVVEIEASQPGDDIYHPAGTVVRSLKVKPSDMSVTGTEDPVANSVRLSPNPATAAVVIQSSQYTLSKIVVTDLLGRSTDYAVDHRLEHRLDTSHLGQGVYVVAIGLDNGLTLFKRLIIQ